MFGSGRTLDVQAFREVLSILVEDQSKQGVRLHKGFPLWWLSYTIGAKDPQKSLEYMLEAFVEDVLSRGHDAFTGFAAASLRTDFGLTAEQLVALKELVVERARVIFYPSDLVKEFVKGKGAFKARKEFEGVTDESQMDSIVAQAREKLGANLRRSIIGQPMSETDIQNVVSAILFQIDPSTERERTIGKLAEKESRIDFSMLAGKVGVEVKLIRDRGQKGSIVDQMNADIAHYLTHFKRVVFVVYDACGAIDDVPGFGSDIKKGRAEIEVLVLKH